MKTKFLFLAAMLLMSVNLFAQNIVKGDVNEDGKIDVADVVAVISIMQQGGGVAILPSSVEFENSSYVLGVNRELKLTPIILPTYATDKTLTWTSSNPSVASVSQDGIVKGISEGSTTITVSTANGKQSTCEVTVNKVTFYWYVGKIEPTESSDVTSAGWTEITTIPSQINVNTDVSRPLSVWYVAIPHEFGFQAYDSTGGAGDGAGWTKSQTPVTIQFVSYDVFTTTGTPIKINAVFKK